MAPKKKRQFTEEELQNPRTAEQFQLALRRKTRIFYDIQQLRLQTQGRVTRKAKGAQIELHPADLKKLQDRLDDLQHVENSALATLDEQLQEVPFYEKVIKPERRGRFKWFGPKMASIIIASFDIHREDTVSKMWAFAGLAPLPATRCKYCFVVVTSVTDRTTVASYRHPKPKGNKCQYGNREILEENTLASGKQMRPVAGEKLKYNAWLRTKLCGVLADVLIKGASPYTKYYYEYKHRWEQAGKGTSQAHRHAAAKRYMIKMVLFDFWKEWRAFEGLPVRSSYAEEYLGHTTSQPSVKEMVDKTARELQAPETTLMDELHDAEVEELMADGMDDYDESSENGVERAMIEVELARDAVVDRRSRA